MKELNIPLEPGVYLMKKGDKIIYIGKAKNLRRRVHSYFNREHRDEKTRELVKNIEAIETIVCNTELDALVLENNLIKRHTPKYNIVLKDEKTYPYIRFSREKFPKISVIRTTKALNTESGYYFGPYPAGVWELKKALIKIFKIRDCNRDMTKTYDRPCLKYFMDLCPGPCTYKNIGDRYREQVENAKKLLKGRGGEVIEDIRVRMGKASEEMRFEEAIIYRNHLKELETAVKNQVTEYSKAIEEDIFIFSLEGGRLFLCVLNIIEGKVLGKNSSTTDLQGKIYEDLFQEIVTDYYSKHGIPDNITFQGEYEEEEELISSWLNLKREGKRKKSVELHFPKIKSRRLDLLNMARLNLEKDIRDHYLKKSVLEKGLMQLYEVLELRRVPRRIECFDISNIQGKDAVGSMSVAIEGRLAKREYRKFKIQTKDTPDDFHMMREVMTRRYSKLKEHELPDLILIDGGLGQLSSVGEILKGLKKEVFLDIISIAKREEEIFKLGENVPYIFADNDESLRILQRLRDEAHRFGVTYHRTLRSKRVLKSELDDILGVGKIRKEKLIKRFGSVKKIREATIEELAEVVPLSVAEEVYRGLRKNVEEESIGNR